MKINRWCDRISKLIFFIGCIFAFGFKSLWMGLLFFLGCLVLTLFFSIWGEERPPQK